MLDQLGFGVSDVAASKAFFTAALAPPGYTAVIEVGVGIGIGKPILWLAPADRAPAPLYIACHTADRAVSGPACSCRKCGRADAQVNHADRVADGAEPIRPRASTRPVATAGAFCGSLLLA